MQPLDFKTKMSRDLRDTVITGERIILCAIHRKYAADIFKTFTPEITRYMIPKSPDHIDEVLDYIRSSRKKMENGEELVLTILKKEDQSFLGGCGLHSGEDLLKPEVGIWIKKDAHGSKYGREAIKMLILWALEHIRFESIIYPVDRENIASRKIPESLGGRIFKEKIIKLMNGKDSDELSYEIPYDQVKGLIKQSFEADPPA